MENILLNLLNINILLYFLAAIFYLIYIFKGKTGKTGTYITLLGLGFTSVCLAVRWKMTGNIPLSNIFEFGLFSIWGIVLIFLITQWKYEIKTVGSFLLPMVTVFLAWLTFKQDPTNVSPLMPALRSYWLHIHVLIAVIAYGALTVSFAIAFMYLVKDFSTKSNSPNKLLQSFPELEIMEKVTYKIIIFAMPLLTLVIITGAIWAEKAWGNYWSWDPKETWALITWLIYAVYLHVRFIKGWQGRKAMTLAIMGFAAVLFTFFGVTYLLPSLHSYV